ncbi:MAG: hypothetical protein WBC51_05695 [Vicinamibacterales bacterium]|jgi:hypothetical protein
MAARRSIASALWLTIALPTLASAQTLVIHKEGTREYHRAWCPAIRDGKGVMALTLGQANARGLKPHAECDKEPPTAAGTTGDGALLGKPSGPVFVFVDGTKYYHREDCAKRSGSMKREALDAAAKTHWPCPACRPPVRKKGEGPAIPKRGTRG